MSGREYRAEVHQPRWPLRVLAMTAFLVATVSFFTVMSAGKFGIAFFAFALGGALAWIAARLFPVRRRGLVEVRDSTLVIDGEASLERKKIFLVSANPHARNAVVVWGRWHLIHGAITIILESAEDAKALVSDLQWDETQSAAQFWLNWGTYDEHQRRMLKATFFSGLPMAGSLGWVLWSPSSPSWILFLGLFLWWAALTLALNRLNGMVRVGADGISMRAQLGPKRFIAYEAIESVTRREKEISLLLKTGESVAMSLGKSEGPSSVRYVGDVSTVDALFQRIENARALFSSRAEIRSHLLAALKRDGRSLPEWREAATSLSREHYRVAATPRDVLETIVQDSAVAPDVRIGAALALHADAGARVRVATETSALPELGAAIDAALDGDDPALERAIKTLKLTS